MHGGHSGSRCYGFEIMANDNLKVEGRRRLGGRTGAQPSDQRWLSQHTSLVTRASAPLWLHSANTQPYSSTMSMTTFKTHFYRWYLRRRFSWPSPLGIQKTVPRPKTFAAGRIAGCHYHHPSQPSPPSRSRKEQIVSASFFRLTATLHRQQCQHPLPKPTRCYLRNVCAVFLSILYAGLSLNCESTKEM